MITKKHISLTAKLMLICLTLFNASCDSDAVTGQAGDDPSIVPADPELNNFIITSRGEELVRVDANTGAEQVIYTFEESNEIANLPYYQNGVVYVGTGNNSINALNIETGQFLWEQPMLQYRWSNSGVSGTVCESSICYATGKFGVVVAVDAPTGQLKWYYSLDSDGELDNILSDGGTPAIWDDRLYVASEGGFISNFPAYLHVLDKNTGQFLGKIELPVDMTGYLKFSDNTLLVPAGSLYALNAESLELQWAFELDEVGTPIVSGNQVLVHGTGTISSVRSSLYCLDLNTGELQWSLETGADDLYTPVIAGDVVFAVHDDGSSFAFNRNGRSFAARISDGQVIWFNDDLSVDTSPVFANGRLFFYGHNLAGEGDNSENVGLVCVDANTGKLVWLNNYFRHESATIPLVVAQNGTFGPGYYE